MMAAAGAAGAHHPAWIPPDFEAIPAELRTLHRWVCWRFEPRAPGEEPGKIPYDARSIKSRASSTDPTTWASFDEAANAYAERAGEPDAYDGVGVVLDGDRLSGVDIDDCVHDGVPDPRALALLDKLGAAYVEISPSGNGLRALGYADRLPKGCKGLHDGLKVELYSTARYLTLTGKTLRAGPIGPLTGFRELADTISADRKVDPNTGEIRDTPPDEHQAELIRRVLSGDVFHDSLRDLAASYVATNMYPGAVVNALRALMDASGAPKDERFKARRGEIPKLVDDAVRKFKAPHSPGATDSPDVFEFVPASDLLTNPLPVQFLIDELLEHPAVFLLFAPPGAGKSFVAVDWGASVATGRPWLGRDTMQGPVFYLAGEGHRGIARRLRAWEMHHGVSLKDAPFFVSRVAANLIDPADTQRVIDAIQALTKAHGQPALVVIDTLARNMGDGDENKTQDMGRFVRSVDSIKDQLRGASMGIVHHSGHLEAERERGSSVLGGAIDDSFRIEPVGGKMRLIHKKAKDRELIVPVLMELEQIELDWLDTKGRPITSAVVKAASELAGGTTADKKLSPANHVALQTFYAAAAVHGEQSADEHSVCLHLEQWREQFYAKSTAENQDAKRKAFNRARQELIERGLLTVENDVYSCPANAGGMIAARLVAGHVTSAGQGVTNVTASVEEMRDKRDTHLIGVSRCPATDEQVAPEITENLNVPLSTEKKPKRRAKLVPAENAENAPTASSPGRRRKPPAPPTAGA